MSPYPAGSGAPAAAKGRTVIAGENPRPAGDGSAECVVEDGRAEPHQLEKEAVKGGSGDEDVHDGIDGPEKTRAQKRNQKKYEKKKAKKAERTMNGDGKEKDKGVNDDAPPRADDLPPPTTPYEIQMACGARGKNFSLVATSDIVRGTRILSGVPLLYFPAVPSPDQIITAVQKLSRRNKTTYLNLTAPGTAATAASAKEDYEAYILRVWKANAIDPFTPEADWTNSGAPLGSDARAIYPVSARLNHSCTPNCVSSFDTSKPPKANLHVVRNIAAGEELTIAYAHVHSVTCTDQSTTLCGGFKNPEWGVDVCAGWSVRRQATRDLGFECDCKACDRSDKLFRRHHARRERIAELWERLKDSSIPPDTADILNVIQDQLSRANELVAWLEEEGLVGVELARAYAHARAYEAMLSPTKRYRAVQVQWKHMEIIQTCYGKDSAAYKQADAVMAVLRRRS